MLILLIATVYNHDKLNFLNSIGLAICLSGITVHVIIKSIESKSHTQLLHQRKIFTEYWSKYMHLVDTIMYMYMHSNYACYLNKYAKFTTE